MATENADKRQKPFYTGDRQLARRVQELLDSLPAGQLKYVDPAWLADCLQSTYREYYRRKKLAFRKSVQRVYDWIAKQKTKQKTKQPSLEVVEQKHLAKRRKKEKYNRDEFADDWKSDDEDSASFSDALDDYIETKDTNMVNDSLSRLYSSRGTPSVMSLGNQTNSPQISRTECLSTTLSSTPGTTPGTMPGVQCDTDSDSDSMELGGNLTLEVLDNEEEAEPPRRRRNDVMLPRIPNKEQTSIPGKQKNKRKLSKPNISEGNTDKRARLGLEKNSKAKKKIAEPKVSTVTFDDIGGNDATLHEVCKLLVHMRHPEVYKQLGVTPPRGVLLHGPPGCGKTLLAHAIAGELQLPFLKIASTEIVSGVSGESEGNIRDLFEEALGLAPCVLFLDEIDAITPKRETAQREMERRIVAQLLSCMDELAASPLHVLVIGATNRADSLDPALRRAGRFDREICLGIPGERERERILQVLCRNLRLGCDFSYQRLSSLTPGYVGADLMALCREAAMCAVNRIFQGLQQSEPTIPLEGPADNPTIALEGPTDDTTMPLEGPDDSPTVPQPAPADCCIMKDTDSVVRSPGTALCRTEATKPADPEPTYRRVLVWLKEQPPLTDEQLQELYIAMNDFEEALAHVQPSAKREGFATIPDVTWDDIGALQSIREELTMAILAPVRNPAAFKSLGLTNPPGILLAGPPGCGKTLLAKAIANESGINFISVKGPELMNMYVGESERAVRQCFHRARNSAPCVIFFDELDALCPKRSDSAESGSSARVVNQLLTEMDGLEARKQVFIVGATNRPDIIDPAVLRPGRLDKTLYVGIPSPDDRAAILKTITKNGSRPVLTDDVNLDTIGHDQRCAGFTGADLAALVREASMAALRAVLSTVPLDTAGGNSSQEGQQQQISVTGANFESAFVKVKPSVSKKDRDRYRRLQLNTTDLIEKPPISDST